MFRSIVLGGILFLQLSAQAAVENCTSATFKDSYERTLSQFSTTVKSSPAGALALIEKDRGQFDEQIKNCVTKKSVKYEQMQEAFDYQLMLASLVDLKVDKSGQFSKVSCEEVQSLVEVQGVFPTQEELMNSSTETNVLKLLKEVCTQ